MKDLVSIIIPVYNTAAFLSECLDSVLSQTYNEIEVILVDDGSIDDSLSICNDYAQKDGRFKVIHQENNGAASARNTGLDQAAGKYIMFCDSDDMVSDRWVEHMLQFVSDTKTIMPLCNHCDCSEQLGTVVHDSEVKANVVFTQNSLFRENLIKKIGYLWNTLFLKELIDRAGLRFRSQKDKADYNEDLLFVTTYLNYVDGFVYSGYADYAYLTRENSLSRALNPYYFEKYKEKYEISRGLIQKYGNESDRKESATYYLYHFLISYKEAVAKNNYQRFKSIVNAEVTQDCLIYADSHKEDPREIALLRNGHTRLLWIYNKLLKMKG